MPHIKIDMFAGRDDETKKKVADAIVEMFLSVNVMWSLIQQQKH